MIIFTKDLPTTKILFSNINNVVEFGTDAVIAPAKVTIVFLGVTIILYPNPTGKFYFNFKDWISSKINVDNFRDDLNVNIQNSGYIYNWTNKVFLNTNIVFTVTLVNAVTHTATKNVSFISGQIQLEDFKRKYPINLIINNPFILSAYTDNANNKCFFKYWEGYPFDITIYTGSATAMTITNLSNLLSYNFTGLYIVNRLAFSDGNTTFTINNILSIPTGFNELQFTSNTANYYAEIEKISDACAGHYIKWINDFGGWNYWLFGKGNINRRTKDLGEIENDFYNLEDTISPTIQIGKTANDVLQVTTGTLNSKENILIQSLIESPKIYLFTGQPYAKNNFNDWMEVVLNTSDIRIQNSRQQLNDMTLSFELPVRNTRKL